MWALETEDGKTVTERDCYWPSLPGDIRIRELTYQDRRGGKGKVYGYAAYGFQRFSIAPSGGRVIAHAGTQLICVLDDKVTIIEINESTGERSQRVIPRQELTYAPELLRDGVGG